MNTSPRPPPVSHLPRPVSHSPSPGEQPRGFPVRSPDAAAFRIQREKESAFGPLWSSTQERVLWGHPSHLTLSPSPPRRLFLEEVPGFVVRWPRHHEVSHRLRHRCLVDSPNVALTQCPGTGAAPGGPLLPSSRRHLAPGPSSSWKIISPLVTEALAAGYKAC